MARYYYERYTVRSSTTYRWDRYYADPVYVEGSFGAPTSQGDKTSYNYYPSYSFNPYDGHFSNVPPSITIYPGGSGTVYSALVVTLYAYYFDSRPGNNTLWMKKKTSSFSHYKQGSLIDYTYAGYSAYTNNARNADGYWYVRGSSSTSYYRGTYIDTIVAEDGTYPDNGRVGTSYWYVKTGKAFPEFKVRQNGQLKTSVDGWVRVNGVLKQIQQIWVRVNGSLKEV